MAKIEAPEWAMTRAKSIISSGETILNVWVISDQNRKNAIAPWLCCFLFPPWWEIAIPCSPCICMAMYSGNEHMKTTVYILTDKRIYMSLDKPQQIVCCPPNRGSGDVLLADVTSVGMDMLGVYPCCPTKQVVLGLPVGHPLANLGGNIKKGVPDTKMAMLVDDPEAGVKLIREAKDRAGAAGCSVVATTAGVAVAVPMQVVAVPMQMER